MLEFKDRNGDDMVTMSSDEETSQDAHEGSTCQCHRSHCFIGCDQSEEIEEHDTEMTSVLEGSSLMYDDLLDLQTVSDSDLGYQDDVSNTGDDIPGLETVSNSDLDKDDDYQKIRTLTAESIWQISPTYCLRCSTNMIRKHIGQPHCIDTMVM